MRFSVDTTGAEQKIRGLKSLPRAEARQLTAWMTETLAAIVRAGILHTRSGQLMRNVDFLVRQGPPVSAVIGTGVNKAKSVVYARILEEGGDIVPKGHPFLTIPLPGVQGTVANYPHSFLATSAGGQWLICEHVGRQGFRVLFLLRRKVTMPAKHWLSRPINSMRPELDRMLSPDELWKIAQALGE